MFLKGKNLHKLERNGLKKNSLYLQEPLPSFLQVNIDNNKVKNQGLHDRWEQIANFIGTRSVKDVIAKAKESKTSKRKNSS